MLRRPLIATVLVALGALFLGACEVRGEVRVDVDDDGSGTVVVTVRLDPEAAGRLGDPATALRTQDLVDAGWRVAAPRTQDDGLELRATRSFASPEDLPSVMAEVGGSKGLFSNVSLRLDDGFASTSYDFAAHVELSGDLEQFGDDDLTAVLDGLPLARTPEQLANEGAADPDSMSLDVLIDLPGGEPTTNGKVVDGAASWTFPVTGGVGTSEDLESSSTTDSSFTKLAAIASAVLLVCAAVVAAIGWSRRDR